MKSLILLLMLVISFPVYSQDKVNAKDEAQPNILTEEWIAKIASDPVMRLKMVDMMFEKTEGNKEERMNLLNSIRKNHEMNKITSAAAESARRENFSLEPRGMMNDSTKVKKAYTMEPLNKK